MSERLSREDLQRVETKLLYGLERLTGVEITCYFRGVFYDLYEREGANPIQADAALCNRLREGCDGQALPYIYVDDFHIAYAAVRGELRSQAPQPGEAMEAEAVYYLIGPMALAPLDRVQLHRLYTRYGIKEVQEQQPPVMASQRMLQLVLIAEGLIRRTTHDESDLLRANHLQKNLSFDKDAVPRFTMEAEDLAFYHHSYQEEHRLLDCVRRGDLEEAVRLNLQVDETVGQLAMNRTAQARKLLVVSVTLNTRAAIEGGVPPHEAYQISDFYLQKMDGCANEAELLACKNEAIRTLCLHVQQHQKKHHSSYVECCISYIAQHYREPIYLEELAEKTGLSPSYLSRLFSKETGMSFQEFVVQERVNRAANLLRYSAASIAQIGDYVGFPNQSYFGRMFKRYKQMTPKAYRDRYKPHEFD